MATKKKTFHFYSKNHEENVKESDADGHSTWSDDEFQQIFAPSRDAQYKRMEKTVCVPFLRDFWLIYHGIVASFEKS